MNRLVTAVLTAVLTVAVATSAVCSESDGPASARSLAARAVQMLSRGQVRSVAEIMHYPPTYTPEERKKDVSSTGDGLDLIAHEFGTISGVKAHTGVAAFYELGGSGGDVSYLSSLSPHQSQQFLYEAKFSKRGDGYIRVTVIQLTADSRFEVLGVYFGLPAADPHSKPAILAITRKQLIQMQVPVTPDVERQIQESLKPVRYPK
jgi:hypothetical protein